MINKDLANYIYTKVVPMYKKHDRAHDEEHAKEVITASFVIGKLVKEPIDENILLASAALHDVGIIVSRDNHNMHSSKIIRNLRPLKKWFNEEEIEIIAQVAEDHRASSGRTPRSIYGKIVADGDRTSLIKAERLMERTWLYRIDTMGDASDEEIFTDMWNHMNFKFGTKAGYAKLNLRETEIAYGKDIKRTRKICDDKDIARKLFYKMRKNGKLKR